MTEQQLWQDYRFLTNEIENFLIKQDVEMVNELLNQRASLQKAIEECSASDFSTSTEGREYLQTITAKNQKIVQLLHMLRNRSQKNHAVANAYDNLGRVHTGAMINSKR